MRSYFRKQSSTTARITVSWKLDLEGDLALAVPGRAGMTAKSYKNVITGVLVLVAWLLGGFARVVVFLARKDDAFA